MPTLKRKKMEYDDYYFRVWLLEIYIMNVIFDDSMVIAIIVSIIVEDEILLPKCFLIFWNNFSIFWALQASMLKTGQNYDHLFKQIRAKLGITTNDKHHRQTIQMNLWCILKLFREIWQDTANHRKAFLDELMIAAKTTKNKQWQQLIWHLKTTKDNRWSIAITRAILKPQSAGGLTHVLEMSDHGTTWTKVIDPEAMK